MPFIGPVFATFKLLKEAKDWLDMNKTKQQAKVMA